MHVHRLAPLAIALALAFSSLACADFTTDDATYSARLISGAIEVMRIDEKNDTCVHLVIGAGADPANIPEGYHDVEHEPDDQRLGYASVTMGAADCAFDVDVGFGHVKDVDGRMRVRDIVDNPLPYGCRIDLDLELKSDSPDVPTVHLQVADLVVDIPICQ